MSNHQTTLGRGGPSVFPIALGCYRPVVTFTITPTASVTRLALVQSGFKPAQKQNFGGARYGWKMMGG